MMKRVPIMMSAIDSAPFGDLAFSMWTRKRTRIAGAVDDRGDDWTVMRNGQPVGRVYRTHGGIIGPRYAWGTVVYPSDRGSCASLDEALAEMRGAIRARWPDWPGHLPVSSAK